MSRPTQESVVTVRAWSYNGTACEVSESTFFTDKNTHLAVMKWGRRCGKHHNQAKAHLLENRLIEKEERAAERRERESLRNPVLTEEVLEALAKLRGV